MHPEPAKRILLFAGFDDQKSGEATFLRGCGPLQRTETSAFGGGLARLWAEQ
jgi:hypothetical protein